MNVEALRTVAFIHGLLAWIAVAVTAASAWLASRRALSPSPPLGSKRRLSVAAAALATALLSATGALGLVLHAPYRSRLRQRIFVQSPHIGWLFERKEHLAFGAIALAWCALLALLALELHQRRRRPPASADLTSKHLQQTVVSSYAASAFLAAAAAAASAIVAHKHSF